MSARQAKTRLQNPENPIILKILILTKPRNRPIVPLYGEGRNVEGRPRVLSESEFTGFRFARIAFFAIIGDFAKTNAG